MQRVQNWCMRNKAWTVVIALAIISAGLYVDIALNKEHNSIMSAGSHALIIFGEAVVVMFFLHVWVEAKNHEEHLASSKIIIDDLKDKTLEVMTDQTVRFQQLFAETLEGIQSQVALTTDQIKIDLFEALLKDKMPAKMVRLMMDSKLFKPTFLRDTLDISYTFDRVEDRFFVMNIDIEFDIEYVVGHEQEITYEMPFSLSDSPVATYNLKEAGYRRFVNGQMDSSLTKYTNSQNDFLKKEFGPNNEKDYYTLNNRIRLKKNEKIRVYQTIEVKYNLENEAVLDDYFVNHHTMNTTIKITLPSDYQFVLYPSFPEEDLPTPMIIAGATVYENIKLLIPGQGWGFAILKKN